MLYLLKLSFSYLTDYCVFMFAARTQNTFVFIRKIVDTNEFECVDYKSVPWKQRLLHLAEGEWRHTDALSA